MRGVSALVAVVTAVVVAAGSAGAATPTLGAYVNDSFKIGVTKAGKPVKSLKAGKYLIVVADTTSSHNFHLKGPGVDKTTSVGDKRTYRWTVTLKKGTYTFVCDPHASFMKGSFTVN
jgi:plastocyanin